MHLSLLSGATPQRFDLAPTQNTALFGFLHPDFRALENELSVLQTQLSTVEQKLQTLNPPSTPAQVFTKRINTLETGLKDVLETLQRHVKKSEETNAIYEHLKTSTAKHDGQIKALQSAIDILKGSHEELKNENASLKKRLTEQDSKIKSMQAAHQEALSGVLKERDKKNLMVQITELTSICEFLKAENLVMHEKIESLKEKSESCQTPTSSKTDSLASTVRLESASPLAENLVMHEKVESLKEKSESCQTPTSSKTDSLASTVRLESASPLLEENIPPANTAKTVSLFNDFIESQREQVRIIHKIRNQETLTETESGTWGANLINIQNILLKNVIYTLIFGLTHNERMQIHLNYIADVIEAEFLRSGTFKYAIKLLEKSERNKELSIVITSLIFSRLSEENFKLCYEKNPEEFQTSLGCFQENMKSFILTFNINDIIFFLQILYKAMFSLEKSKNLPLTKYKIILMEDENRSLRLCYNKEGAIIENIEAYISVKIKLESGFVKSYFERMRRK